MLERHLKGWGFSFSHFTKQVPEVHPMMCTMSGYCNAYVIKSVLDFSRGSNFDSSHILRFVSAVEDNYSSKLDPNTQPEVEYAAGRSGGGRGGGGYHHGGGYGGGYHHGGGYGGGGWGGAGAGLALGTLGGLALGSAIGSANSSGYNNYPGYAYPAYSQYPYGYQYPYSYGYY